MIMTVIVDNLIIYQQPFNVKHLLIIFSNINKLAICDRRIEMETTDVFAERFKKLRLEKKLSLQKVAQDLNVTAQSLSLYEKGQRTINIDLLKRTAEYFKVSSDYLIGISDVATVDTDLKSICEYTGLTEENIILLNALKELKEIRKKLIKNNEDYVIEYIDIISSLIDNLNTLSSIIFNITNAATVNENDEPDLYTSNDYNYHNSIVLSGYDKKVFYMQQIESDINLIIKRIVNKVAPKEFINPYSDLNINLEIPSTDGFSLESLANAQIIGISYRLEREANKNAQHNPKKE